MNGSTAALIGMSVDAERHMRRILSDPDIRSLVDNARGTFQLFAPMALTPMAWLMRMEISIDSHVAQVLARDAMRMSNNGIGLRSGRDQRLKNPRAVGPKAMARQSVDAVRGAVDYRPELHGGTDDEIAGKILALLRERRNAVKTT